MADKFLTVLEGGLKWIGKGITSATEWVPRLLKITKDVEADVPEVLPEVAAVLEDATGLATAAVKDAGTGILAADVLVAAIENAAAVKGLDISKDEAVGVAFKAFIVAITTSSNYKDVIAAAKKIVVDVDKLTGTATAALKQLEADAKS
jgi:hypothetical protein